MTRAMFALFLFLSIARTAAAQVMPVSTEQTTTTNAADRSISLAPVPVVTRGETAQPVRGAGRNTAAGTRSRARFEFALRSAAAAALSATSTIRSSARRFECDSRWACTPRVPDRAEFFYAKCGCYRELPEHDPALRSRRERTIRRPRQRSELPAVLCVCRIRRDRARLRVRGVAPPMDTAADARRARKPGRRLRFEGGREVRAGHHRGDVADRAGQDVSARRAIPGTGSVRATPASSRGCSITATCRSARRSPRSLPCGFRSADRTACRQQSMENSPAVFSRTASARASRCTAPRT